MTDVRPAIAAGSPVEPARLRCRGLVKRYGDATVLDGFDLSVRPGRVYALLGRNGAGKSTAFKLILGLLQPDAGGIELLGRPWHRAALAQVGASVNGPALYGHLSAAQNLAVHAALLGGERTGASPDRITALLDRLGLGDTGRRRARTFSTGMQARLALAIALLGDPEILLLDEPQNGLDPEGIVELRHLIRDHAAAGRTVLISSHQLGEVAHLADDIGVLAGGRLVYQGPLNAFAPQGELEAAYFAATAPQVVPDGAR